MAVLVIVSASTIANAQSGTSSLPQPFAYPSVEALVQQLRSEDDSVRMKAATSVGLTDPVGGSICSANEEVRVHPISVGNGVDSRLLSIKASSECRAMFLVPMLRQGGSWVALKPIRLSAHYDDPNWRLESLVAAGEEGIVVSNQTVDWGTGYLQRNMTIYKVIGNEARIVFDAPEYIGVGIPPAGMGPGWKNGYEDVQRSKFEFLRDTNINGLSRIQEMRTESAQKRRFTVYRSYVWEPSLQAFRMVGSTP